MEAREFRVGNLVNWIRNDDSVEAVSIYNITRTTVRCYTEIEELEEVLLSYGEINPIHLTEEWLIRFGFKYEDGKYCTTNWTGLFLKFELQWNIKRSTNSGEHLILLGIQYIHQLQNIYFALTGEELEIK